MSRTHNERGAQGRGWYLITRSLSKKKKNTEKKKRKGRKKEREKGEENLAVYGLSDG